jgi:hypothetical protein
MADHDPPDNFVPFRRPGEPAGLTARDRIDLQFGEALRRLPPEKVAELRGVMEEILAKQEPGLKLQRYLARRPGRVVRLVVGVGEYDVVGPERRIYVRRRVFGAL